MDNKQQILEYLFKLVNNLGFGNKLNDAIASGVRREKLEKFPVGLTEFHTRPQMDNVKAKEAILDQTKFELQFKRSNSGDNVFLNSIRATLYKVGEQLPITQLFDIDRDYRMSKLQMVKLLYGMSFQKEIYPKRSQIHDSENKTEKVPEKKPVWFKLITDVTDSYTNHPIKHFYPEYNYDLESILTKFPLPDLQNAEKLNEAISYLKNGNYVSGIMLIAGKKTAVKIRANPLNELDVFDKNDIVISRNIIFPDEKREKQEKITTAEKQKVENEINLQKDQPWIQDPNQEQSSKLGR